MKKRMKYDGTNIYKNFAPAFFAYTVDYTSNAADCSGFLADFLNFIITAVPR